MQVISEGGAVCGVSLQGPVMTLNIKSRIEAAYLTLDVDCLYAGPLESDKDRLQFIRPDDYTINFSAIAKDKRTAAVRHRSHTLQTAGAADTGLLSSLPSLSGLLAGSYLILSNRIREVQRSQTGFEPSLTLGQTQKQRLIRTATGTPRYYKYNPPNR
ncbi:hypothetical protein J6590_030040 [Homalodisca vitripennis]|nr:hypothetical protein J6590_030040 [Homalodisca vitripennis]